MSVRNEVAEFYDRWVPDQVKIGINLRHRKIFSLLKKYGLRPHHRVLEIGCGVGPVTGLIARYLTSGEITGVDISPKSVEQARANLKAYSNATVQVSDMTDFESDVIFDVIVLPDVLEHIPLASHTALFRLLRSLLSGSGFIFIHIPEPSYQDWVRAREPEKLQVIDHSLYTVDLICPIRGTDLYVTDLKSHRIFRKIPDYQYVVVRPKRIHSLVRSRNKYAVFFSSILYRFF